MIHLVGINFHVRVQSAPNSSSADQEIPNGERTNPKKQCNVNCAGSRGFVW